MRSETRVPSTKIKYNGEPLYPDALIFTDYQGHLEEYDGPMAWQGAWRTPFTIRFIMGEGVKVANWGEIENSDESFRFHRAGRTYWNSRNWRSVEQKENFTRAEKIRNKQGSISELS